MAEGSDIVFELASFEPLKIKFPERDARGTSTRIVLPPFEVLRFVDSDNPDEGGEVFTERFTYEYTVPHSITGVVWLDVPAAFGILWNHIPALQNWFRMIQELCMKGRPPQGISNLRRLEDDRGD